MREQDVFIIGTAYSGSTLLGLSLNAHSQMAYIGETSRIRKLDNKFHIANYPTLNCFYCLINHKPCPLWNEHTEKEIELDSIFSVTRRIMKKPVIIDGSKLTHWISLLQSKGNLNSSTKLIILVKNPFAFANSAANRENYKPWVGANIWRDTYYDAIRFANRHNLPHLLVRYEEFAMEPKKFLEKICVFFGSGV